MLFFIVMFVPPNLETSYRPEDYLQEPINTECKSRDFLNNCGNHSENIFLFYKLDVKVEI